MTDIDSLSDDSLFEIFKIIEHCRPIISVVCKRWDAICRTRKIRKIMEDGGAKFIFNLKDIPLRKNENRIFSLWIPSAFTIKIEEGGVEKPPLILQFLEEYAEYFTEECGLGFKYVLINKKLFQYFLSHRLIKLAVLSIQFFKYDETLIDIPLKSSNKIGYLSAAEIFSVFPNDNYFIFNNKLLENIYEGKKNTFGDKLLTSRGPRGFFHAAIDRRVLYGGIWLFDIINEVYEAKLDIAIECKLLSLLFQCCNVNNFEGLDKIFCKINESRYYHKVMDSFLESLILTFEKGGETGPSDLIKNCILRTETDTKHFPLPDIIDRKFLMREGCGRSYEIAKMSMLIIALGYVWNIWPLFPPKSNELKIITDYFEESFPAINMEEFKTGGIFFKTIYEAVVAPAKIQPANYIS